MTIYEAIDTIPKPTDRTRNSTRVATGPTPIGRSTRWKASVVVAGLAAALFVTSPTKAPAAQTEPEWLSTVNAYRAASGLGPISNDAALQAGVDKHVQYLASSASLVHNEDSGAAGFSPEGALAAQQSLLGGWKNANRTDRQVVEDLLIAPFHAVHLFEPRWERGAYASSRDVPGASLSVAGVLNVTGGIGKRVPIHEPVLFPGRGATIPMTSFVTEVPSPLTACPGYAAPAGLPIFALFPSLPSTAVGSVRQGENQIEVCVIDRNYSNPDAAAQATGRQLMNQKNMIMVIPKAPLTAGLSYDVVIDGGTAGKANWSFTIGVPDVALPVPSVTRVADGTGSATSGTPMVKLQLALPAVPPSMTTS